MNSRSHLFTLNNYTPADEQQIADCFDRKEVKYIIYGKEISATGTPHLQGYLYTSNRVNLDWLREHLSGTAHFEAADGSHEQNRAYCSKGTGTSAAPQNADVTTLGEMPRQGKRKDLDDFKAASVLGMTKRQMMEDDQHWKVWFRNRHSAELTRQYWNHRNEGGNPDDFPLDAFLMDDLDINDGKTIILYGPTSVGKTTFAVAHFKNPLFVCDMDDLKNLDEGSHDGIVFDDMSFMHIPRDPQVHIVDQRRRNSIRIRFVTCSIPRKFPKIITTNRESCESARNDETDANGTHLRVLLDDPAINARCSYVEFQPGFVHFCARAPNQQ